MSRNMHATGRRTAPHHDSTARSRRDAILQAAIQAFAAGGFRGASTRGIAEAAGIKFPLLYYHFKSKADLYLAALENQLHKLATGLEVALADEEDAEARLKTFVEVYLYYFLECEPGLTVTLRELNGLPADIANDIAMMHHTEITGRLEAILAAGVEHGVFRPLNAATCALAIIGILQIFIRAAARTPGRYTRAEAIEQVLGFYAAGMRPGAEAATCAAARAAHTT